MGAFRKALIRTAGAIVDKADLRAIRSRGRGLCKMVRPRSVPLHRDEGFAPFFVMGSGRCGTTLFRRLIQAQGNTYVPPENWALGRCIRLFHKYAWVMDWKDMVDLQVGRLSHRSHHWFDEPPRKLVRKLREYPHDKRSLAALISEEYHYHAELKEKDLNRWGDNSPGNVFSAEPISEVFPEAKFVHLLRDGVDVVASWIKYPPYTDDLEGAADKWRWSVWQAREFMSEYPDKVIEVSYETLVRKPEATMRRICNFLDHPFSPEALEEREPLSTMDDVVERQQHVNVRETISTENIGKGRRQLDEEQKRVIAPLIQETLDATGYDPVFH